MLPRWSRICWKWSRFWKACNKQSTWEWWTCSGCNQQRSATDRWELEADLGIPKTAVSEILMQDLGMKRVVAKFVPRLLLPEQKEHRAAVANGLIQTATNEPDFLKKVITRDESCGSTATHMIWKQRPSCPRGGRLVLHTQRSHSRVAARSRPR